MAPDRLKWRDLVPGAAVTAVLVAVVLGVLLFARVGAIRGETFVVYAAFPEARLIIPNSEVWLLGEKVGAVEEITFRPPAEDTTTHVQLRLRLWESARRYIREDATAQLRSGGSLLGAPVVYIAGGSREAPPVTPGDTLLAIGRLDPDIVQANIALGLADARGVLADLRNVMVDVGRTRSTVSGLLDGSADGGRIRVGADDLMRSAQRLTAMDEGSLGQLMRDRGIRARSAAIQARLDSLVTATRAPAGTAGLVRSDSALTRAVAALLADAQLLRGEVSALTAALSAPVAPPGTAADTLRLAPDTATVPSIPTPASRAARELRAELADVDSAMAALIADLKRRPWRYIPF